MNLYVIDLSENKTCIIGAIFIALVNSVSIPFPF